MVLPLRGRRREKSHMVRPHFLTRHALRCFSHFRMNSLPGPPCRSKIESPKSRTKKKALAIPKRVVLSTVKPMEKCPSSAKILGDHKSLWRVQVLTKCLFSAPVVFFQKKLSITIFGRWPRLHRSCLHSFDMPWDRHPSAPGILPLGRGI